MSQDRRIVSTADDEDDEDLELLRQAALKTMAAKKKGGHDTGSIERSQSRSRSSSSSSTVYEEIDLESPVSEGKSSSDPGSPVSQGDSLLDADEEKEECEEEDGGSTCAWDEPVDISFDVDSRQAEDSKIIENLTVTFANDNSKAGSSEEEEEEGDGGVTERLSGLEQREDDVEVMDQDSEIEDQEGSESMDEDQGDEDEVEDEVPEEGDNDEDGDDDNDYDEDENLEGGENMEAGSVSIAEDLNEGEEQKEEEEVEWVEKEKVNSSEIEKESSRLQSPNKGKQATVRNKLTIYAEPNKTATLPGSNQQDSKKDSISKPLGKNLGVFKKMPKTCVGKKEGSLSKTSTASDSASENNQQKAKSKNLQKAQSAGEIKDDVDSNADCISIGGSSSDSLSDFDDEPGTKGVKSRIGLKIPAFKDKSTKTKTRSHSRSRSPTLSRSNNDLRSRYRGLVDKDSHRNPRDRRSPRRSRSPLRRRSASLQRYKQGLSQRILREKDRERSRSHSKQGRSPLRRDRSSQRRQLSPVQREKSPLMRDRGPLRREKNSVKRERSPVKRDRSPINRVRSTGLKSREKDGLNTKRGRSRSPSKIRSQKVDKNLSVNKNNDSLSAKPKGPVHSRLQLPQKSLEEEVIKISKPKPVSETDSILDKKADIVKNVKKASATQNGKQSKILGKVDARKRLSAKTVPVLSKKISINIKTKVLSTKQEAKETVRGEEEDLRLLLKKKPEIDEGVVDGRDEKERELDARIAKIKERNNAILMRNLEVQKDKERFG
ncbi:serine/threonine-protein kinase PRP4 homolog [Nematostella vectensis]|uniref:serine/threonine-protein kinase PRP4 homolog n=1 Tax=Nematostella vectensis TaxID=45351 RepID=UPI00138FC5DA|nr:serine/threonine-protein kinase PRP4 homolog [Nematostella vectensis]